MRYFSRILPSTSGTFAQGVAESRVAKCPAERRRRASYALTVGQMRNTDGIASPEIDYDKKKKNTSRCL
jgi:hypothetical protein